MTSKLIRIATLLIPILFLNSGCEDDSYNYTPPAGQGAVIINNNTGDHIEVYMDGTEQPKTNSGENRAYPQTPGKIRVVLNDSGTDRTWRGDVDVLEGRNTVMDVSVNVDNWNEYLVVVYLD